MCVDHPEILINTCGGFYPLSVSSSFTLIFLLITHNACWVVSSSIHVWSNARNALLVSRCFCVEIDCRNLENHVVLGKGFWAIFVVLSPFISIQKYTSPLFAILSPLRISHSLLSSRIQMIRGMDLVHNEEANY